MINLYKGTRAEDVIGNTRYFSLHHYHNFSVLPSTAAMEGVNDPNPPTQAAKNKKVFKLKIQNPPQVSLKRHVYCKNS